jgi:hypothetical protein
MKISKSPSLNPTQMNVEDLEFLSSFVIENSIIWQKIDGLILIRPMEQGLLNIEQFFQKNFLKKNRN